MKTNKSKFYLFLLLICFVACNRNQQNNLPEFKVKDYTLWYKQPANGWDQALPLGNGRIGAMVYGGVFKDTIQFNEESLWAGCKTNSNNPKALDSLDILRELLFEEQHTEAYQIATNTLLGVPPRIRSYQTMGNIIMEHEYTVNDSIKNYMRSLNLNAGLSNTSYHVGETLIEKEYFTSTSDNVIIIRCKTKGDKKINTRISLRRPVDAISVIHKNGSILMKGQVIDEPGNIYGKGGSHMKFASLLDIIQHTGEITTDSNDLIINNASNFTIAIAAFTDYNRDSLDFDRSIDPVFKCEKAIDNIRNKPFNTLLSDHIAKHSEVFNRMEFTLSEKRSDSLPTNIRLQNVIDGGIDESLTEVYFQYGRYLLMCSSGFLAELPANLQGIWNHHLNAPWSSDYHTNINLQMNYWPAEVCNLSETILPYTYFFNTISRNPGSVTAYEMYDCNGWTMHHVTNVFGYTAVNAEIKYGMFPMGAAWVCFPLWRHYEFTKDKEYLEKFAWPIVKRATEFVLDFLIESPEGYLVTSPSYSPENSFIVNESGKTTKLTYGPTMDIMIINELFNYSLKAINVLGDNSDLKNRIIAAKGKLPPIQIGSDSTIQEWIKDYKEAEPGHRHISHLLALHPGTEITPETPELFDAACKTIEKRLNNGGGHTGWSRAWIINFYARLLDSENAYKHLQLLFQKSTLQNLFDTHPPFQIDGNFGATAGIAEMLIQSHNDKIVLLPALPSAWQNGEIHGICARGGFELSFNWQRGVLVNVKVLSKAGGDCELYYMDKSIKFKSVKNNLYCLDSNLKITN